MTVHQAIKLINEYHKNRLVWTERRFLEEILDGLDGLGDLNDREVLEYISEKQVRWVWQIAKRFLIRKETKI